MAKGPTKDDSERKPLNLKPLLDDELESILSAEERVEIEAAAEKSALTEKKAQAKAQYRAKVEEKRKRAAGLLEPQVEVTIDCGPTADRIVIDNKTYFQGHRYTVPQSLYAVFAETMQNTWRHQEEIDGKDENFYRQKRAPRVVPTADGGVAVVGQVLRA